MLAGVLRFKEKKKSKSSWDIEKSDISAHTDKTPGSRVQENDSAGFSAPCKNPNDQDQDKTVVHMFLAKVSKAAPKHISPFMFSTPV